MMYLYQNECLQLCPNFHYPDTFKYCQLCSDFPARGCANCSSPSVCLSCDAGYVLLNGNCLLTTPDGYLNISGVATACQGDCELCSLTLTNCTACKTLNLFINTCMQDCPSRTIALNQICEPCLSPCDTCVNSTSKCLTCTDDSSLFLSQQQYKCVGAALCPDLTYPDTLTQVCSSCQSPCVECESLSVCVTCIEGYFLLTGSGACVVECPTGMAGVELSGEC